MTNARGVPHPKLLIFALIMAELVAIFEGSMIYAAMGTFYEVFGDPIAVGWTLTAFLLVSASTALVCGRLADMYGRRRVVLILLVFSIVGSLISATANDIHGVILGRAIQGFTSAVLPISYGLMREHLSRQQALTGIGIVASVMTVGGGVGVFVGGLILDLLSWRWIFYFSSGVSILAFALIYVFVPPSWQLSEKTRIDWGGALLFVVPTATVLYAISSARSWGWVDGRALGLIGAGLLALVIWVFYELRHRQPLVDVRMLSRRQPLLANLAMMMIALGPLQAMAFITLQMQQPQWAGPGLGLSPSVAGILLFFPMSMGLLGGPCASYIAARFSARHALIAATTLVLVGWGAITLHHTTLWLLFVMLMAVGAGKAMASAAVPMLILEAVPAERTSEATATITSLRPAAMGVGVQISSYLLTLSLVENPDLGAGTYPGDSAFLLLYGFVALTSLLALVAALALPRGVNARA